MSGERIDWDSMAIPDHEILKPVSVSVNGTARKASGMEGGFIKGPVPLSWVKKACHQRGSVAQLSFRLWYLVGKRNSDTVKLSMSHLEEFGLTRPTATRALKRLEAAGLVQVIRKPGRFSVVTVIRGQKVEGVPQ